MTRRAIASTAVDWQVQAQAGADPAVVADAVARFPHVASALPVGLGDSAGFQAAAIAAIDFDTRNI